MLARTPADLAGGALLHRILCGNLGRRDLGLGLGMLLGSGLSLSLGLGLGLNLSIVLLDGLALECRQLAAVYKKLPDQPALRCDCAPLLNNEHDHQAVRDHEQDSQNGQQRTLRFSRCCGHVDNRIIRKQVAPLFWAVTNRLLLKLQLAHH
jgi:hypothetical protein